MKTRNLVCLVSLISLIFCFFTTNLWACNGKKYYVRGVVDLRGEVLKLPANTTIVFEDNGKLINGTVQGNKSNIKHLHDDCIGVLLTGSWTVKEISDTWFDKKILSDNEIINNLNVIQSDSLKQVLRIDRDYSINLSSECNTGLYIASNTTVKLNAQISITGNNLTRYDIVSIAGKENVVINGGEIKGDVGNHNYVKGSTSEWGFGVYIYESKNVTISNLKVSLCIGDGFYISGSSGGALNDYSKASKNIKLLKCTVYDTRRDGISLIHADGVFIEDFRAINIGQTEYTAPSYGINIEPNKGKSVRDVTIKRYISTNTKAEYAFSSGGYQLNGNSSNREKIVLDDCDMDKGVAIMSGAVMINHSKMNKVAIYPQEMPSGKVVFKNCSIVGGNGIELDGRTKVDIKGDNAPAYVFKNCFIAPAKAYKRMPALIWGTHLENIKGVFSFENCKITLPEGESYYNLIFKDLPATISFYDCEINSSLYPLLPFGAYFKNCRISCLYVDGANTSERISELNNCTITTNHATKRIVNESGLRLSSNTTFVGK